MNTTKSNHKSKRLFSRPVNQSLMIFVLVLTKSMLPPFPKLLLTLPTLLTKSVTFVKS